MEIQDKALVVQLLNRFGLSPEKIQRVEAVIDGQFDSSPTVVNYDRAAEFLGLTAKNRAKTIALWVRQGKLQGVYPPGAKQSIGINIESLRAFANSRKVIKGDNHATT